MGKAQRLKGNLLIENGKLSAKSDPRFEYDCGRKTFTLSGIEKPVRHAARKLHEKYIYTYYSEGGGINHSYTDYAFVLSRLTGNNAMIAKRNNFILDSIVLNKPTGEVETIRLYGEEYNVPVRKPEVINLTHPENARIGHYLLGINRSGMNDRQVSRKLGSLVDLLEMQEDDLAERSEGITRDDEPEIEQWRSILDKI